MSSQETGPFELKTSGHVVGEAHGFVKIEFHVELASKKTTTHVSADCDIDTNIGGLKQDLKNVFALPVEQQIWTIGSDILRDNDTLAVYGITGTEKRIQIDVKRRP